jgi:GNAT superfamily N-acetyltransferase
VEIGPIRPFEFGAVVALWRRCGLAEEGEAALEDIRRNQASANAALLVGRAGAVVIATVMVGFDGHRAWAYYVATDPDRQGEGRGREMMAAAEAWARERGAPKLMLMVAHANEGVLGFYARLGFEAAPMAVLRTPL